MIESYQFYLGMIISGLCGGIGSALGAYIVNRAVIRHIDKLDRKLSRKNGKRKNT